MALITCTTARFTCPEQMGDQEGEAETAMPVQPKERNLTLPPTHTHACACTCSYTDTWTWTYPHICTWIYLHPHLGLHLYSHLYLPVSTPGPVPTYLCQHPHYTHTYACTRIGTCACIHTCTHIYNYACSHTHTHTYLHPHLSLHSHPYLYLPTWVCTHTCSWTDLYPPAPVSALFSVPRLCGGPFAPGRQPSHSLWMCSGPQGRILSSSSPCLPPLLPEGSISLTFPPLSTSIKLHPNSESASAEGSSQSHPAPNPRLLCIGGCPFQAPDTPIPPSGAHPGLRGWG